MSIKCVIYSIASIYLFELVTVRLLTFNNVVALGELFRNVPLVKRFCSYDLHMKSSL